MLHVSVQRASSPSDITNVHSDAQSESAAHAALNDNAEAEAAAVGAALAPNLSGAGVLEFHHTK